MTRLQTDLNQRERQKYAALLRSGSEACLLGASALEDEDDTAAMIQVTILSLTLQPTMAELRKVFLEAAQLLKASHDLEGTPTYRRDEGGQAST